MPLFSSPSYAKFFMMQYFNIQVASQVSGVTSATIRAWEKRYHTVTPERASNGHRLYSNDDIQKLSLLSKLTEIGQNIGKIAHLSIEELKSVYQQVFNHPFENVGIPFYDPEIEFNTIFQNISRAVQAKKFQIIGHELEKALLQTNPRSLCLQVIIPLLKEFDRLKEKDALINLLSFFLGKIIWNSISESDKSEEILIFSSEPNGILPLILGVVLIEKKSVPYFIFQNEEDLNEFIHEKPSLKLFTFSDIALEGVLSTRIPSEVDSFRDFLNGLEEAPQRMKHLS